MKSKLKKIIILFMGLLIAFSLNNTLIDNKGAQNEFDIPKISAGYSESFIHVDGNWTDTKNDNDWCIGSGTWQEPYVIENVTIDASSSPTGSGIFINNSKNEFFIIRNCTVYNGGSGEYDGGIKLKNTSNGTLIKNNCSNNGRDGIYLHKSNNNTIQGNIANDNADEGIQLYSGSDFNLISGNNVSNNINGISLNSNCSNNAILNNNASNNKNYGIYLYTLQKIL